MHWHDTWTSKLLRSTTDAVAFVGLLGGALIALVLKGSEWGPAAAIVVGGTIGSLAGWIGASIMRRTLSQPCPACNGKGRVSDTAIDRVAAVLPCSRCGGDGRIL